MTLPGLLLLTDRSQLPVGRTLDDTVRRCVDAGLEAVVVRELDLPPPERQRLAELVAEAGATAITARTWLFGAHGVHLSSAQTGLDAGRAPFHGRSCHNDEDVGRAVGGGASYLTISPVATSKSKPGYGPAMGAEGVRQAVELAGGTPVFALGGVDVSNVAAMREAGAHGAAVMGAVMRADDPAAVVAEILERVR